MKKQLLIIQCICAITAMALIATCAPPISVTKGYGSITLPGSQNATSRNLYQWPQAIASFRAIGTGPDAANFDRAWTSGNSCQVDNLASGAWQVQVTALDSGGTPLLTGTQPVNVIANQNVSCSLKLGVIPGNGSVSFSVNWDAGTGVASAEGEFLVDGSASQPLAFTVNGNSANATLSSVASSDHHGYAVRLKDAQGKTVFANNGTIHVTAGLNTPVTINASASAIANPPSQPGNLAVAQSAFTANLTWTDSDGESGYYLERRQNSGAWVQLAELPADSSSFRDTSVLSSQSYEYKLTAWNLKGEKSTNFSLTTADFSIQMVAKRIAFNYTSTARIERDGSVKVYGTNRNGEQGISGNVPSTGGKTIAGLTNAIAVDANDSLNCSFIALKSDGTVWQWGYTPSSTPAQVAIPRQVVEICYGDFAGMARDADGKIWVWGNNYHGQYGSGNTISQSSPYQVTGLPEITQISIGGRHCLALSATGDVYAWGDNNYGELGSGDRTNCYTPRKVNGLGSINKILIPKDANRCSSYAVASDGTVWFWGEQNGFTSNFQLSPMAIPGASGIKDVAAMADNTFLIDSSGRVWGIGYDQELLLGRASNTQAQLLPSLTGIKQIIANSYKVAAFDGSQWLAWGKQIYGDLTNGKLSIVTTPVSVASPASFIDLASGYDHCLALDNDGNVWIWGGNECGQLGDGTTTPRALPQKISLPRKAISVSASLYRSAAVLDDGSVMLWGGNAYQASYPSAIAVTGVIKVGLGDGFTVLLKSDGTVFAFGFGNDGELGNNSTGYSSTPVQVLGVGGSGYLTGVKDIAVGRSHVIAQLADDSLVGWGDDYDYQLGQACANSHSLVPIALPGFSATSQVLADQYFTLQYRGGSTLWASGTIFGVRNLNYNFASYYAGPPANLAKLALSAQSKNMLALISDGTVKCFGYNDYSQLGINNLISTYSGWVTPSGPAAITKITVGDGFMVAYSASTGQLWGWGKNGLGQLGQTSNTPDYCLSPTALPNF